MKKKIVLVIVIAIILALLIGAFFIMHNLNQNNKKVKIEEIKQYNYFVLKQGDKNGVIDTKGNVIVKPEYDQVELPNPEKAIFICYQGESTKVVNEKEEQILTEFENVEPIQLKNIASDLIYEKSVLKFQKDGKYGIVDFSGKEIVKPIYEEIDSLKFKEGELLVKQNGKYGIININGAKLINIEYDEVKSDEYYTDNDKYENSGYIVANKTQEGYRYGYINNNGKKILPVEYNDITRVYEEYLLCAKNGQYGVNKNKEVIINNEYQSIRYDSSNQIFIAEKSGKYGVINLKGEIIIPINYSQIDITGEYLYAQNEQGTTVYESTGEEANIESNIAIVSTKSDKYKIKINNKDTTRYGVINKNNKQVIEEKYSYIEYLYDDLFIVSNENGKLGIIDENENVKIEINNNSLQKVQETDLIQTIGENENTQIYDKKMSKICEMSKATIEIINDYIKIYNEEEVKYFDKEGKEVEVSKVYPNNKLFVEKQNNKYGYKNSDGKIIVKCDYDKAYEFNEYGFATVQKDGKWGCINEKGEEIVEPIYEFNIEDKIEFVGKYYRVNYGFGEFYYTDNKTK